MFHGVRSCDSSWTYSPTMPSLTSGHDFRPPQGILREGADVGGDDPVAAKGVDERKPVVRLVHRRDVGVRRHDRAEEVAEGDLDRWDVIERAQAHLQHALRRLRRFPGETGGQGQAAAAPTYCSPDLVARFAGEASKSAQRVLEMCLRALDYIPPVEITFGDFLRAVVTADADVAPVDEANYRLAFVDAFRRYGIIPADVGTLSEDALRWPEVVAGGEAGIVGEYVHELSQERTPWNMPQDRQELWELLERKREALRDRLRSHGGKIGPVNLEKPFEVQSFHPRDRGTLNGDLAFQWVIKLVQQTGPAPRKRKRELEAGPPPRSGVTLLVDADTGRIRYQIEKTASPRRPASSFRPRAVVGNVMKPPRVTERRLRVFAFDPSLSGQLETAPMNEVTIRVPWERDAEGADILKAGPVGEYLEVVDRDPASGCFYEPVDLNDRIGLPRTACRRRRAIPSFTSRWSMPSPCGQSDLRTGARTTRALAPHVERTTAG